MAINTQKVMVAGLAAGVVLAALDFVFNGLLLAEQNRAAMEALSPEIAANMENPSLIAGFIVIDLIFGVLVTWTYAAMRPRFGAGPRTSVMAGLQVWLVAGIMYGFMTLAGFFSWSLLRAGSGRRADHYPGRRLRRRHAVQGGVTPGAGCTDGRVPTDRGSP